MNLNPILSEAWSSMTDDELIAILLDESSSTNHKYYSLQVIEERYDLDEEELQEIVGFLAKAALGAGRVLSGIKNVAASGALGNSIASVAKGGLGSSLKQGMKNKLSSGIDNAIHNIWRANDKDKIHSSDDIFAKRVQHKPNDDDNYHSSDDNKNYTKSDDFTKSDDYKKSPVSIFNKPVSKFARKRIIKTAMDSLPKVGIRLNKEDESMDFKNKEMFIENLDSDILGFVLEDEEFSYESKLYAFMELIERGEIELTEEVIDILNEADPSFLQKVMGAKDLSSAGSAIKKSAGSMFKNSSDPFKTIPTKTQVSKAVKTATGAPQAKNTPFTNPSNNPFKVIPKPSEVAKNVQKATGAPPAKNTPFTNLGKPMASTQSAKPISNPVTSTQKAKPANNPVAKKSLPSAAKPMNRPSGNNQNLSDIRAAAKNMLGATRGAAGATGALKSAASNFANSGRTGGAKPQSSAQTHAAIGKLGGEPTRPVKSIPKAASPIKPASPPPLTRATAKGGKWM